MFHFLCMFHVFYSTLPPSPPSPQHTADVEKGSMVKLSDDDDEDGSVGGHDNDDDDRFDSIKKVGAKLITKNGTNESLYSRVVGGEGSGGVVI